MKTIIILLLTIAYSLSYGQGSGLYKFRSSKGKYGFMDKTGKIKIKAKYLIASDFSEGLCYVSKKVINDEFRWIFIDTIGKKAFSLKNNFPETGFKEGFARISNLTEHWFVNKKGINEFGKTWKDGYGEFKNGVAYVSDEEFSNRFYPINDKGETLSFQMFSGLKIDGLREIDDLEKKSKTKLKEKFKSDKYIPFQENEFWGFKDSLNNVVIPPVFYLVDKFENGVCAVRINEVQYEMLNDHFLDALIDENGEILIKIDMHCYSGFQGELIKFYGRINCGGGIHYLNRYGQKIIPTK